MTGPRRFLLSGCSGGGKSTLLSVLAGRGYLTFEEPGRRIVREALANGEDTLPWENPEAFATRAIELSVAAFDAAAGEEGLVFYDRSFIDAVSYLEHSCGHVDAMHQALIEERRFERTVFLAPPWAEIFVNDAERQGAFDQAVKEFHRLERAFSEFGYEPVLLPRVSVEERIDFLLTHIGAPLI
ncbi:MAG: AAA family ATPase [Parvibaculaceae bacterium]